MSCRRRGTLPVDKGPVSYRLVRMRRRTLSLTVTDEGETLVKAPLLLPKRTIDAFVSARAPWIEKRQSAVKARPVYHFTDGEQLPYLGSFITLRLKADAKRASFRDGVLTLPMEDAALVRGRVIRFYRNEAHKVFAERIAYYAPRMGVSPGPLSVSSAKTLWGSCGPTGTINLCYRLMLGKPEYLDYVVVHELAHLVHRDHSKAFWAVVERTTPDYKARRKALNDNRLELMI